MNMIVELHFDTKYFRWVPLLLRSFKLREPDVKFALYTFNLSDDQIIELEKFKNIAFWDKKVEKYDTSIASGWLYQIVCRKGAFILDVMGRFKSENLFISMDVDMVLLRNLNELKKSMADNDVGFFRVGKGKIASGFIAIANTENAKKFMQEYYDIATEGVMCHKKDQPVLAFLYEKYKDKMKFLLLDRRYIDHSIGKSISDPYILSAHKTITGTKEIKYGIYKKIVENMENNPDEKNLSNILKQACKNRGQT